ncbi:hypothetical protein [Tepidibacillus marianensis]|uniref:hypothetical protein n=1 Tax=Tepidibacillus marianensis TaxID=3131995 RepID=UPI00338D38A7
MIEYHQSEQPKIDFNVTCSKGTYIRTLCVDIGKYLGYPAHMSQLIRTKSGPFHLDQTITLEKIEQLVEQKGLEEFIVSMSESLPHLPQVIFTNDIIEKRFIMDKKLISNYHCPMKDF